MHGLTNIEVSSTEEVMVLVKKAYKNRASHSTNLNEVSSRSHMILTLTVNTVDERDGSITSAKLKLVDLAGSERVKDSGASGQ